MKPTIMSLVADFLVNTSAMFTPANTAMAQEENRKDNPTELAEKNDPEYTEKENPTKEEEELAKDLAKKHEKMLREKISTSYDGDNKDIKKQLKQQAKDTDIDIVVMVDPDGQTHYKVITTEVMPLTGVKTESSEIISAAQARMMEQTNQLDDYFAVMVKPKENFFTGDDTALAESREEFVSRYDSPEDAEKARQGLIQQGKQFEFLKNATKDPLDEFNYQVTLKEGGEDPVFQVTPYILGTNEVSTVQEITFSVMQQKIDEMKDALTPDQQEAFQDLLKRQETIIEFRNAQDDTVPKPADPKNDAIKNDQYQP